jgi:cysteine desulfurase
MKINNTIYLDHHSTTPTDPVVLEAMDRFARESFGNPHSAEHVMGWAAHKAVEDAQRAVGALIGADVDEIIFTSGATEANNLALFGVACGKLKSAKRSRILISSIEHKCVINSARAIAARYGYIVDVVDVDCSGYISVESLERSMSDDVLLFSCILVNNEIGSIQDMSGIKRMCDKYGVLLHCDAAQAPVTMDLSRYADIVDMLSLSSHKMYGPMGIGALYIRRDLQPLIEPLVYGGGQQNNIRSGTLPLPLCVGMGKASNICHSEYIQNGFQVMQKLRNKFVTLLMASNWDIRLNGPALAERHVGNANMCFEGFQAQDIIAALQPKLAASSGSACTSGLPAPSHVLRAIGLSPASANASIRFSIGRYTVANEIEEAASLVLATLREISERE